MVYRVIQSGLPRGVVQDTPNPLIQGLDSAASTLLDLGPKLAQIDLQKRRLANEETMQQADLADRADRRASAGRAEQLQNVQSAPSQFKSTPSPFINAVAGRAEQEQAMKGLQPEGWNDRQTATPQELFQSPYAAAFGDRTPSPANDAYQRYLDEHNAKIRGTEAKATAAEGLPAYRQQKLGIDQQNADTNEVRADSAKQVVVDRMSPAAKAKMQNEYEDIDRDYSAELHRIQEEESFWGPGSKRSAQFATQRQQAAANRTQRKGEVADRYLGGGSQPAPAAPPAQTPSAPSSLPPGWTIKQH